MVARICGDELAKGVQADVAAELRKGITSWTEVWQLQRDLSRCMAGVAVPGVGQEATESVCDAGEEERDAGKATERERLEDGGISLSAQSLGYALRQFLDEHFLLASQLEQQLRKERQSPSALSLQALWFYLQPSLRVMHLLQRLARDLRQAAREQQPPTLLPSGPAVLATLHRHCLALSAYDPFPALHTHAPARALTPFALYVSQSLSLSLPASLLLLPSPSLCSSLSIPHTLSHTFSLSRCYLLLRSSLLRKASLLPFAA